MEQKKGIHYAWWILVSCCVFYGCGVGMLGNTMGIFLDPVMKEMNWSRTDASYYMSISGLVVAFMQPVAGRMFAKFDIRKILSVVILVLGVAYMASAKFNSLTSWNVFGAVIGVCNAFLFYLPIPILINSWFQKKVGTALGIAVAFASITAVFANPFGQWLISNYDWRTARIVFGAIALVCTLPFTIFVVRKTPAEKGLQPYGYEEMMKQANASVSGTELPGMSFSSAIKTPALWCFFIMACLIVTCASMHVQTPGYAKWSGLGPAAGAKAVSVIMIGGIVGKMLLGWLNDRIGILATGIFATLVGAIGGLVVYFNGNNVGVFFTGAFMFGVGYAALTVVPPFLVRKVFGMKNYSQIFSVITFGLGLFGGAVAPMLYARMYDAQKSFAIHWPVVVGMFLAALLFLLLGYASGRKLDWSK